MAGIRSILLSAEIRGCLMAALKDRHCIPKEKIAGSFPPFPDPATIDGMNTVNTFTPSHFAGYLLASVFHDLMV
jgi:hypothetical protein